ncbi:hypothetical protein KKA85_02530 [bacterium]|nr:hypothetical protein [bacterium]
MLILIATMPLPLTTPTRSAGPDIRWFSSRGHVVHHEAHIEVFVGGTLVSVLDSTDRYARNVLLVGLTHDQDTRRGALASAFGISAETLRKLCRTAEDKGMDGLPSRGPGGSESKVTAALRRRLYRLFDRGVSIQETSRRVSRASYGTAWRVHQEWKKVHEATDGIQEQLPLLETPSRSTASPGAICDSKDPVDVVAVEAEDEFDGGSIHAEPLQGGRFIQHVGSWLMLGMLEQYGVYSLIEQLWGSRRGWGMLRVALDAVVIALCIGQRCVEGVRRVATSTAPGLLRADGAPSESWTRRVLKRFVERAGSGRLHLAFGERMLKMSRIEGDTPAVFYVDNHTRPYTGKYTIRKGWRMQDKRAVPGTTDYYVHDEDGRPVLRVDVPSHDSLTAWLRPLGELLRKALGKEQRILLAFDRAGAFPEQMAELRDANFEAVTYERRPYPKLPDSAFDQSMELGEETIRYHEKRKRNLGKGRGRVRLIAVKTEHGAQVNLLAVAKKDVPASRLIETMKGRWCQENGFKHGNERWGINQLDQRKIEDVPAGTVIPNPARRRLDRALKIARTREGEARRQLAHLDEVKSEASREKKRIEYEEELEEAQRQQRELIALRPSIPTHAPVEQTELAGKLARHPGHVKTVLDTLRIACANAESDLAGELAPAMKRPAEAKKALANLLRAPGHVRVNGNSVSVTLLPAATPEEAVAFDEFLPVVNSWGLVLPGDPERRTLRFRSQIA